MASGVDVRAGQDIDGDTVTITLSDLPNGTVFSLRLDGAVAPRADGTFGFTTTDLVMPFSLEQVQASLEETETNSSSGRAAPGRGRPVRDRAEDRDRGRPRQRGRPLGHGRPGATTVRGVASRTMTVSVYANTEKVDDNVIAHGVVAFDRHADPHDSGRLRS